MFTPDVTYKLSTIFFHVYSAEGWGFNLFSRSGLIPACLAIENRFCLSLIYCSIQHPAGKLILPLKRWMSLCFHLWGEWTLSSNEELNHTTLSMKWWMWLLSNWRGERAHSLNEEVNVSILLWLVQSKWNKQNVNYTWHKFIPPLITQIRYKEANVFMCQASSNISRITRNEKKIGSTRSRF